MLISYSQIANIHSTHLYSMNVIAVFVKIKQQFCLL